MSQKQTEQREPTPAIVRNKNGEGYHLSNKTGKDIVIPAGGVAFFRTPAQKLASLVAANKISAEKAEELSARYSKGGDLDFIAMELNGILEGQ